MDFEEAWDKYKDLRYEGWKYDYGEKSPLQLLMEEKYEAFKEGWHQSRKEAIADTIDAMIDEYKHCLREGLGPETAFQVAVDAVIESQKLREGG